VDRSRLMMMIEHVVPTSLSEVIKVIKVGKREENRDDRIYEVFVSPSYPITPFKSVAKFSLIFYHGIKITE
jgi:hypothetical protein